MSSHHHSIRAVGVTAFALSVLAAAAGCGSSSSSAQSQGAVTTLSPTATVPEAATTLALPTTPAAAGGPSSPAAVPTIGSAKTKLPLAPTPGAPGGPCQTGDVKVTASNSNGAAGTQVERFLITNAGTHSCTLQSYPGVSIYGPMKQGGSTVEANLSVSVKPIPSGFGDLGGPGGLVTLGPNGTAAFFVKWSDVPSGSAPCPTGDGFSFTTPADNSHQVLITFAFGAVCGSTIYDSQVFPPSVTS